MQDRTDFIRIPEVDMIEKFFDCYYYDFEENYYQDMPIYIFHKGGSPFIRVTLRKGYNLTLKDLDRLNKFWSNPWICNYRINSSMFNVLTHRANVILTEVIQTSGNNYKVDRSFIIGDHDLTAYYSVDESSTAGSHIHYFKNIENVILFKEEGI